VGGIMFNAVYDLRQLEDRDISLGITTFAGSTMAIVGLPGTGTHLHVDRHDARNVCFGVRWDEEWLLDPTTADWKAEFPEACAVWVCISPKRSKELAALQRKRGYWAGLQHDFVQEGRWEVV